MSGSNKKSECYENDENFRLVCDQFRAIFANYQRTLLSQWKDQSEETITEAFRSHKEETYEKLEAILRKFEVAEASGKLMDGVEVYRNQLFNLIKGDGEC